MRKTPTGFLNDLLHDEPAPSEPHDLAYHVQRRQPPADPHPRGRDTSSALTEIRTVLSRAQNALETLALHCTTDPTKATYTTWDGRVMPNGAYDPELAEMQAALAEVVAKLDRWRRTGRPLKGGGK